MGGATAYPPDLADQRARMEILRRRMVAAGLAGVMDERGADAGTIAEATGVSRHIIDVFVTSDGRRPKSATGDEIDRLAEWAELPTSLYAAIAPAGPGEEGVSGL